MNLPAKFALAGRQLRRHFQNLGMVQPRNLPAKPGTVTAGFDAVFNVVQRG